MQVRCTLQVRSSVASTEATTFPSVFLVGGVRFSAARGEVLNPAVSCVIAAGVGQTSLFVLAQCDASPPYASLTGPHSYGNLQS